MVEKGLTNFQSSSGTEGGTGEVAVPPPADQDSPMRIALFLPCFNDALFPRTGIATVRILRELGHEVIFPAGQTCCGQVHFNTGFRREASRLMNRFLEIFGDAGTIVAPSASCVAMVREQFGELAAWSGEESTQEAVRQVAERTFELSEFLVGVLGVEDVGAVFQHRVVYHPTCHSTRSIDVGDAPLKLLEGVEGLELVALENASDCCGFGGTFSVKNPHTSTAMMEDKIRAVESSGAEVLTAVDNSCLMHLAGGMRRKGSLMGQGYSREEDRPAGQGIQVLHLAEILARGMGGEG